MTTLYEKFGGSAGIDAAVDLFYRKMLSDDRVNYFFDDINMDEQIAKQKGFLTMVLGGPNHYTGKDMREGHRHLLAKGLNDSHVDIVIQHLGEALQELGVAASDIAEVANIANSVRDDVLDR